MAYDVEIITVPSRLVAVARLHVTSDEITSMGERLARAFGAVLGHLGRSGVATGGPAMACFERVGDGFQVAAGFPVGETFVPSPEVDQVVIGGGEVAHTTHVGRYDGLPAAYDALRRAVEERGRVLSEDGPRWEEYWTDQEPPAEEARTEVFWPVRPI